MAFPADLLDVEVSIALGADLTADPGTWVWTDITDYVRENEKIAIRRGRTGKFAQVTASRCTLTVDNTDGRFSRHNPHGVWYGQIDKNTPLRVRVNNGSGYVNRFCGFVTGWPPAWDPSEADQTVSLSADGIMRRLGRDPLILSPMRRSLSAISANGYTPIAYWPMEDGINSTVFASAFPGGAPLDRGAHVYVGTTTPGELEYAEENTLPGSLPLPVFGTAISVKGTIPIYTETGRWVYQIMVRVPSNLADEDLMSLLDLRTTNTSLPYVFLTINPLAGELRVDVYNAAVSLTDQMIPTFTAADIIDKWVSLTIVSQADGSGSDDVLSVYLTNLDGESLLSGTTSMSVDANFHGMLRSVEILSPSGDDGLGNFDEGGTAFGHSLVIVDAAFAIGTDHVYHALAAGGWNGESAIDRVTRLARESGIPVTITGDVSCAMGIQRTTRTLELYRDCATADQGLLYEPLDFGLAFIAGRNLLNQSPAITLQYDQGHVLSPFVPDDDDRDFYNDITAQRPDGAPMRYADADSVARVGSYPLPVQPNVETDAQALQVAAWLTAVGTVDELQWPALKPNFRRAPELIDAWMASDIGSNLAITGHPSPLAAGDIIQIVDGYTEVLSSVTFEATITLSPATIHNSVGVWELMAHELHASINTSTTSIDIATTDVDQPLLATSGLGSGYPIQIGGEELQITAVAASTVTFGATGTASTGASGSRAPGLPTGSADGNLIVIYASTRNSGTGVPDTPADWERWPIFHAAANCQVFARIYDGVWSMPTVTFTGGAANEDTIAQSCRLPGKWHDAGNVLVGHAQLLNASAQNITYPGLSTPICNDGFVLYFGWKADDYTSVTSPGTEIQEASSTAGNDASQVWAYAAQTTPEPVASGVFTVTGGASAISRGAIAVIRCDYQTATAVRSINGVSASHSAGDAVTAVRPMRWALTSS